MKVGGIKINNDNFIFLYTDNVDFLSITDLIGRKGQGDGKQYRFVSV